MSDPNNLEGPPPTTEERAAMARELDAVAPTPADKFRLMLGQRPTPRTDAYKYHAEDGGWIAAPNNGGDIGGLPEIAEELTRLARELADALRERDNAESDRKQAEAATIRALHERNEARKHRDEWFAASLRATKRAGDMREQRDRLASKLRDIKDRALDETVRLHPDADAKGCVDDCLEWAESALAALKGGTDA